MILIPLYVDKYSIFPRWFLSPVSHLTSCTPAKCKLYFDVSFATAMSEPALCRLLTFHVPNLVSIFFSLCRVSRESVQVRGTLWHFITIFFLRWGVACSTPNPFAGGSPLVGCTQLHIHYIHSYPSYREAVSSIRNLRTRHAFVAMDPYVSFLIGYLFVSLHVP
jgi:hypothetical protein